MTNPHLRDTLPQFKNRDSLVPDEVDEDFFELE
jgi:hypothetical protein